MLRVAALTLPRLRHVRTPWLGGVRDLCSNSNRDDYFHYETEGIALFEIWCNKYGKTYSSEDKKVYRFDRFRETLEWCTRENQKHDNPEHRYFDAYSYADQTKKEFRRRFGGWN